MKKIILSTFIGVLLFTGCMVNTPDNMVEVESQTTTTESAPKQEEEPAQEETLTEPQPEETQTPEVITTRKRAIPIVEETEVQAEPEETETSPEIAEPKTEEPKVVDWVAFYNRVLQKGREKYNKKLPWDSLAKDAKIKSGSWMVDGGCCRRTPPKEEEIRKIADALGTSYEWLLYGED